MAYEIWESCVLIPGFSRSECASWVQAWGSIGAILAAAYFVWLQDRLELRRQERAEHARVVGRVAVIYEIARASAHHVRRMQERVDTREKLEAEATKLELGTAGFDMSALRTIEAPLASLNLAELEDPEVVNGVMILLFEVRQFRELVQQAMSRRRQLSTQEFDAALAAIEQSRVSACQSEADLKGKLERLKAGQVRANADRAAALP